MTENVVIADSSKAILKPIYLEINGFFKCAFYDKINIFPIFNCVYNIFFYICILKSKWFCFSHQSDIIIEKINLRKNLPYLLWTI